jgi:transcriptional regulator of acetoin/glycerol metabolism
LTLNSFIREGKAIMDLFHDGVVIVDASGQILYHSERADKPFVTLNSTSIPETLLESELFGYEEGAFSGAERGGKPGLFEIADGGTLFLDELEDLSQSVQAKLLRVIQLKELNRVGGTKKKVVNVCKGNVFLCRSFLDECQKGCIN